MTSYIGASWEWLSSWWSYDTPVKFDPVRFNYLLKSTKIRAEKRKVKTQNAIVQKKKLIQKIIEETQSKDQTAHTLHANVIELIELYRTEKALTGVEEAVEIVSSHMSILQQNIEVTNRDALQALSSLLYAGVRMDLEELRNMIPLLRAKLGAVYTNMAIENSPSCKISSKLTESLSLVHHDEATIYAYLMQLAPDKYKAENMPAPQIALPGLSPSPIVSPDPTLPAVASTDRSASLSSETAISYPSLPTYVVEPTAPPPE